MDGTTCVITGFGAVSPLGISSDQMWTGLREGRCGIGKITAFEPAGFPCTIAGQIKDFSIQNYIPKAYRKWVKIMSRDIELAVAAAYQALVSAGIVTKAIDTENMNINPTRIGISIGAGMISCDLVELAPAVAASKNGDMFDIHKWGTDGLQLVPPLWLLKYLPNMPACHISIIHDIQGPGNSITCAEVSAYLSIIEAVGTISRKKSDIVLAGGVDSKVNPMSITRQCLLARAATVYNDNPAGACRPFDSDARGSVFGEAAGVIVVEDKHNANNRGAKIFAEIAGAGQSSNIPAPNRVDENPQYQHLEPDGKGITIAIQKALSDASIQAKDLDLIIPHGTGILADDLAEAKGIEAAIGATVKNIPAWPTKSMLSNTSAASGALDIIAGLYAINDGFIPAAVNCQKRQAGCNLNISAKPVRKEIRYVLCCGYTFGGQTAAIILKRKD